MQLDVKLESTRMKMEATTTSLAENLSKAMDGLGGQLEKILESSKAAAQDIAANNRLVMEARKSLNDLDYKIDDVKAELSSRIDGVEKEIGSTKVDVNSIRDDMAEQEQRLLDRLKAEKVPTPRDTPTAPRTIEATIQHRRALINGGTSTSGQLQTDSASPRVSGCCGRLRKPTFKIQPFDGNPKNYARFKAKFKALYHDEFEDNPALLFMLEELLTEEVRNEIGECLTDESMYSVVWDRLDAIDGRTEIMDQTYLDNLLQIPPLKSLEAGSLKEFANRLHGAVATLAKSTYSQELHSRTTLMAMEAKLPPNLKDKWNQKRKKDGSELNVLDLDDWITLKAMSKQHGKNVFESLQTSTSKSVRFDEKKPGKGPSATPTSTISHVSTTEGPKLTALSPSTTASPGSQPNTEKIAEKSKRWKCFICNGKNHKLANCTVFISLSPTKRAETVFKSGRCLLCLTGKHERKECSKTVKCIIGGCTGSLHHTLLHGSEFIPPRKSPEPQASSASPPQAFLGAASHSGTLKRCVHFKIVPVRISAGENWFDTYGFLDTGSDTTLIRSDVVSKLGLVGPSKRINVVSYDGATSSVQASVVQFSISSVDGTSKFEVGHAYSVDNLKVTPNSLVTPRQLESWTHLRGLDVPNVQPEDVTVLIGIDVAEAHDHVASIKPPAGTTGPIAFKTLFGWCLGGPTGPPHNNHPFIAHIV